MTRAEPRHRGRRAATGWMVAALAAAVLSGCATSVAVAPSGAASGPAVTPHASTSAAPPPPPVPEVRQGRPARSSRVRFVPESVTLPGNASADVEPAQTVDGELKVPEHVNHVGWWDGSSYIGDPFGTTVIAGHVDSATEGTGFFARLLRIEVGNKVTVRGSGHAATYRIVSVQLVAKQALSTQSHAFDSDGDHQLVLITCAGSYDRSRGGYASNLVVTGVPVGAVR